MATMNSELEVFAKSLTERKAGELQDAARCDEEAPAEMHKVGLIHHAVHKRPSKPWRCDFNL